MRRPLLISRGVLAQEKGAKRRREGGKKRKMYQSTLDVASKLHQLDPTIQIESAAA